MQKLQDIRDRMMPMMELTQRQYKSRVATGYPIIVDDVQRGTIGIEIEPSFALYITQDDTGLSAEVYRRMSRLDSRATASRQKYGGAPLADRRPLPDDVDDQTLRNLIAELKNYVNFQPGNLFLADD